MSSKFKIDVSAQAEEVDGELRNYADYSGYALGHHTEDPHQVPWHAETGWESQDDAVTTAMPRIEHYANQAADEFIKRIKG
jgi:hypothetical protein